MADSFRVLRVHWATDQARLRAVREEVFIREQAVPPDEEWDADDPRSRHVLAVDPDGAPIGTGRLLPDGHIGRMAVLSGWRRRGVASALLGELLSWAREDGHEKILLHAQWHAVPFYARHGFLVEGAPFQEVGIEHRYMWRRL